MSSGFWILEDGRVFSRRWVWMNFMLKLITNELANIEGAFDFYLYLEELVYREELGDEYNGYGGFLGNRAGEDQMFKFEFDLRAFAPQNRRYFWQAVKKATAKLEAANDSKYEGDILLLKTLLYMHQCEENKEDPTEINDCSEVKPDTNEQLGPGW